MIDNNNQEKELYLNNNNNNTMKTLELAKGLKNMEEVYFLLERIYYS